MRLAQNENGSGMVLVLIACAILGSVLFMLLDNRTTAFSQITIANARISALNLKASLPVYFKNDASWQKIRDYAQNNSSLMCIQTAGPNCTNPDFQDIPVVLDGAGNVVVNNLGGGPTVPNGFNQAGEPCHANSVDDPNCPYKLIVQWKPQCAVPCKPSLITITGKIVLNSNTNVNLNQTNYQFTLPRSVP